MPRRPPPRRNAERPLREPLERVEEWAGRDYYVRPLTGSAATKNYRCPGCDHEIRPATPHVLIWPSDDAHGLEHRRHWHTPCWNRRR